jgi:hypothetical protein
VVFLETFDGLPSQPLAFSSSQWDIMAHSRDPLYRQVPEPMDAQHDGATCDVHGAHTITTYTQTAFICRNHLMTAIKGTDYAIVYLAPNAMLDWSQNTATLRFDVSTMRTTSRDWWDIWITPWGDVLSYPSDGSFPDGNGEPRNAIHIRMNQFNGKTTFNVNQVVNYVSSPVPGSIVGGRVYENVLTPDYVRRDTFELRLSSTHISFCMPDYTHCWADNLPLATSLDWNSGVVQIGHHSYNPLKGCIAGRTPCQPNTWHWDNVRMEPALPFQIIRSAPRAASLTITNDTLTLERPAPAGAIVRFLAIGNAIEVSFDGGNTWQPAVKREQENNQPERFSSYWMPIPEGTTAIKVRGQRWTSSSAGDWWVHSLSVWAR